MSRERLQDYFSDLYDGSLDSGLANSIQLRIENDKELASDYRRFCQTMAALKGFDNEVIEEPQFLSSRIASRMESASVPQGGVWSSQWLRGILFGAVGATAIIGAFIGIQQNKQSKNIQAGMLGGLPTNNSQPFDEISIEVKNGEAILKFTSSGPKTVSVNSLDKKFRKSYDVDQTELVVPISNQGELTAGYKITATGDTKVHYVFVPGSSVSTATDLPTEKDALLGEIASYAATEKAVVHFQMNPNTNLDSSLSNFTIQKFEGFRKIESR